MAHAATKFEVARSNGLGGDTFTRNETDAQTQGRTERRRTDFGTKLMYPFSKEKSGHNYNVDKMTRSEPELQHFVLLFESNKDI